MEEQEYLSKAQGGDKAAITRLLMENRELVASVINRLVYEPENRKDIIQNVFMQAIRGISDFKGGCRFSTWLYRLAVNQAIDYNRKKLQMRKIGEVIWDDEYITKGSKQDGFDFVSKKELSRQIGEILDKLPLDQKAAFNLFYFCGHSGIEAAQIMAITEDNFYMKLKAARDRVRKVLGSRGWAR